MLHGRMELGGARAQDPFTAQRATNNRSGKDFPDYHDAAA